MISRYASLRQGLVGAWCPSLGASGFRLIDRSGYNNHGVLTNMDSNTAWVTSGGKGALDFDGVDDRVIMPYKPQFLAASLRSIAGWINVRSFDGDFQVNDIISTDSVSSTSQRGWNIALVDNNNNNSDGTLSLIIFGTGTGNIESQISTEKLAINRWYHFAVTYDGGTLASGIEIFLDGEKQAVTATNSGTFTAPNSPTNPLWIGRRPGIGIDTNFNGQMDDTRLYNRVLTPQEVNQLYVVGRGVGLAPERIKHRRKSTAAAFNRRRRILIGASQ
jgi:hypothetical protein